MAFSQDCGVGTTFCAISPKGEFRICNQSTVVYGMVPEEPVERIWRKRTLGGFRCLSWVTEPCKSCPLLTQCVCGCKVDVNESDQYCIDYAVRGTAGPSQKILESLSYPDPTESYPQKMRRFRVNRFTKVTTLYTQPLLVTRYQTVEIDGIALEMTKELLTGTIGTELDLIKRYSDRVNKADVRRFVKSTASG